MKDSKGQGAAPPGSDAAIGTILVVDDTETSAMALEMACSAVSGATVTLVSSALDAVRILEDGNRNICAVVTDIRMPRMDGFELIQFIRADRTHSTLPIIVVSADTSPDTPERTSRLGADAYFSKPFSPRAVRRTLERLLHVQPSHK